MNSQDKHVSGLGYALLCYSAWGIFPLYWKLLNHIPPAQILAHRIIWSLVFLAGLLVLLRNRIFMDYLRQPRVAGLLLITGLLVGGNWFVYIYAVNSNHIVDSSLGYYINPIVNILLGMIFLDEKLKRLQKLAVLFALAGVAWLTIDLGRLPWISLVLAFSFGIYGLLRKKANLESMPGLLIETLFLAPIALVYLGMVHSKGTGAFLSGSWTTGLLLILGGPITALPLYWFGKAATRIPLSTIGFIQYLAPTLQLLIGLFIYHEPLRPAYLASFLLVWTGLAIYTADLVISLKKGNGLINR